MAKGFSPLIGLAVVLALALAAVFGSMSLANPALADDGPAVTGLTVTEVTQNTIFLEWDAIEDYGASHYRARIYPKEDGVGNNSRWITSDGDRFDVTNAGTVADADTDTEAAPVVANFDNTGTNVQVTMSPGTTYVIQVRSAKDSTVGPIAMLEATPYVRPDVNYTNFDHDGDQANADNLTADPPETADTAVGASKGTDPGNVNLEWRAAVSEVGDTEVSGWQYKTDLEDADWTSTGKVTVKEVDPNTPGDTTDDYYVFKVTLKDQATKATKYQVRAVKGMAFQQAPAALTTYTVTPDAVPFSTYGKPVLSDPVSGVGQVTLEWVDVDEATHFSVQATRVIDGVTYTDIAHSDRKAIDMALLRQVKDMSSRRYTVTGLMPGVEYTFVVKLYGTGTNEGTSDPVKATPDARVVAPVDPSFVAAGDGAGSASSYTVEFQVKYYGTPDKDVSVNTRDYDLIIEFQEDYQVPGTIGNSSVAITTDTDIVDSTKTEVTFTPEDVTVDGNEIFISIGDIDERDDKFEYTFEDGDVISVLFRQSAGIKNPTAADAYQAIEAITFGDVEIDNSPSAFATAIPHSISLDPEDGGLGTEVTVTGKGFKNGTSITFFRDKTNDGMLNLGDSTLCTDTLIEGNIGTCTFEVSHPTFTAGATNHIDGVDGVNSTAGAKSKVFELKASISTSPKGGSPGEKLLVQVVDFSGSQVSTVTLGGQTYCGSTPSPDLETYGCNAGIDSNGSGNFSIVIPNWSRGGVQELKVTDNKGTSASTKVTLAGPQIRMTSRTVIANQRVSLIGTGFSPGAAIANVPNLPDSHVTPTIMVGGDTVPDTRINDGDPVRVDNGGNWSASVDLPLSEATTASGTRKISVMDSLARRGVIEVTVPDRMVTVSPEEGRVGTIALIEGTGFPSKNDEGSNFNVEIEYEAANGNSVTISALTDASGRFEQQMRIPTSAAIPSSNQMHVRFVDDNGQTVAMTVPHEVPEGIITPSETSGGPGSSITISGEGFKSFVPVSLVKVGTLDVTPSPKPSTDGNGMVEFDIIVPGLDVGIQTIEANVGRTTASVGFTVIESGVNPGDIKTAAVATEPLGENLDVVWHFNNDTKSWSYYDGMEDSTLTHMITGETYLIKVKTDQEAILNRDTRNLTCVGGNCWNQIVW